MTFILDRFEPGRPVIVCQPMSRKLRRHAPDIILVTCVGCHHKLGASPESYAQMKPDALDPAQPACWPCHQALAKALTEAGSATITGFPVEALGHPGGNLGWLLEQMLTGGPQPEEEVRSRAEQHEDALAHRPSVHPSRYRARRRR